jgi:hypothetical protein
MTEQKDFDVDEISVGSNEPVFINIERTDKGDYIKNPVTGRKILVGSAVYNKLVKANLLKVDVNDLGRVIYKADTEDEAKNAFSKLQVGTNLVKDRKGNTVRSKARTMKISEMSQKIKDITLQVYELNKEKFNEDMSPQEVQDLIKKLVDNALVSEEPQYQPLKKTIQYVIEQEESDDELAEETEDDE